MSAQHTPGPWEVGMRGGFNANLICDRSGEDEHTDNAICSVFGMYQHQDIDEQKYSKGLANARLIAKAPEMLEALKDAYPYIADDALRERVGNLIADATGVQA
jgi:hypothetical protein